MKYFSPLISCLAVALFCFATNITAQDTSITYLRDPEGRIREHNVDFKKMLLDVKFNTKEGKVMGTVKYTFKPIQYVVDTLFLNAPAIDIKKVLVDGKEAKFTADSQGVTIRFGQSLNWNKEYKLDITYEATPRKGLYFIGWNVEAQNTEHDRFFTRKQIWTQGQGIDNRHWFPCYDDVNDKLVTETVITFDTNYVVVSNGLLKDKKRNADGTFTWHYAMNKPMVPYLVMIAIDKFKYKDYKSKNGIVSREYYYNDQPESVEPTYIYSDSMMDFLSTETGFNYPWQSYANVPVQDFMYGAMENTTATVYGDFLMNDKRQGLERNYTAVNAHELTHQWFGDCITEYSAAHHWLHESFATYYSKQFMHHIMGEDFYEWSKRGEANAAIGADKNDRYPIGHSKGGSARVYPKGSFVIDMIRYVVGDSVFKRSITSYLKKHAYDNVTNHDFMFTFMETAGVNLDWFFDQWVYRAGYPVYDVSYQKQNNQLAFYVKQIQKVDELTSYFKMPIVFEAHFKDGSSTSRKVWISGPADTVYLNAPAGAEVDYTLFDPGSYIIKGLEFNRTYAELAVQAEKAANMIDRYDALVALRGYEVDMKRDLLIRMFNKGDFHPVLTEIISQLSKDRNDATVQLFKKAVYSKDMNVRRAVVDDLEDFPAAILPDVELLLKDSSYITIENTLRKLCKLYPEKGNGYLNQVKDQMGVTNNVRMAWLELKSKGYLADMANAAKYEKQLVEYASNRYEFRTRVRAMETLERLGYVDAAFIANLFNAVLYTNSRLSNPAAKVLKGILKNPDNKKTAQMVFEGTHWKDWEKKAIEGYLNS